MSHAGRLPGSIRNLGRSEEHTNSKDNGLAAASVSGGLSMMEKELEVMVIRIIDRVLQQRGENLIRNIVREELSLVTEKLLTIVNRESENEKHVECLKFLKLQFPNEVASIIWTGELIKGEGCAQIRLELIDALTGEVVESGPEAYAKAEIVVLRGDFGDGEEGNRTSEEFENNIVKREGNKPLLTGDVVVKLNKGICFINNIKFTNCRDWMKCNVFKLGARVINKFDGTRIKEATTQTFEVKDCRIKCKKKYQPPCLSGSVCELKNIRKGGAIHKSLLDAKVETVADFLNMLTKDFESLKCILGLEDKKLADTVTHAKKSLSVLNDKISEHSKGNDLEASEMASRERYTRVRDSIQGTVLPINSTEGPPTLLHSDSFSIYDMGYKDDLLQDSLGQSKNSPLCQALFFCDLEKDQPLCIPPTDDNSHADAQIIEADADHQTNESTVGLVSSETVSPIYDRKKTWTFLFTVVKWYSKRKGVVGSEGSHFRKKQRV